jgi:DNA polymerase-1
MKAKRAFIEACRAELKKPEKYMMCDKATLETFSDKFSWIKDLLEYKRLDKLLNTYVTGIKERAKYNIIRPSFLQHGTTSGRYSSKDPNFQNLPRDDKRIKECIIPRPGMVFVGADYAQLEPRVFASFSQDIELLNCFEKGEDFYSVIGMKAFDINDCIAQKDGPDAFAVKHKTLRQISKTIALSVTYGTTAFKMVDAIKGENGKKLTIDECQKIIDDYLEAFPGVQAFMDQSHKTVVRAGEVQSLFGRVRHIPEAKQLRTYGNFKYDRLPYHLRTLLNLATNHRVQSTAASIINRSVIRLNNELQKNGLCAKIVLQVHDSLVVECKEQEAEKVQQLMQKCMETTCSLPGVRLVAEPKIGKNLSEV